MTDVKKAKVLFWDIENYEVKVNPQGVVTITSKHKRNYGNELSQWLGHDGYLMTKLNSKGVSVHSVVCRCAYGERPDGLVVNHIDGNKLNNHPSNLEYCTIAENIRHSIRLGLHVSGSPERHGKYIDGRATKTREWGKYMKSKAKILYYDLETTPYLAYVWGCGDQVIRHGQLKKGHDRPGIICATYCWNDDKPAKSIDWGYEEQNTDQLVKKFDELIKQADVVIGKNSDRFDNKVLNAARMFAGLPGIPDWTKYTDDLEKHMRKHFRVPSQSLDYYSAQLGLGGKIKMEFQDWVDIVEKNENGLKSFKKMIKYGKKDVEDTRKLWYYMVEHFEPKFKYNVFAGDKSLCMYEDCGAATVIKRGTATTGNTKYQRWICSTCRRCQKSTPYKG